MGIAVIGALWWASWIIYGAWWFVTHPKRVKRSRVKGDRFLDGSMAPPEPAEVRDAGE
jgi:hypothetical protein